MNTPMHGIQEVLLLLVSVLIVVPVLMRFKVSPILGYLVTGALVGPFGLGFFEDTSHIQALAEAGVLFLLFMIGLHLTFERLIAMKHLVFGLGLLQVLITAVIIGTVAYSWENSAQTSILLALSFALSSTAIVSQMLMSRGELHTRFGQNVLAILLFQDLAVVPILVLVDVFAGNGGGSLGGSLLLALIKATVAIGVIILLGRKILRPLFHAVIHNDHPELFTAMALLMILATAFATQQAGLSLALGAFLAGLLLAETEFRHQVQADISPFKGLLLGVFFVSVGMNINFGNFSENIFWIVASVFGLLVLKGSVVTVLSLLFKLPLPQAVRAGFLLAQGGEFVFLTVGMATQGGLMSADVAQFMFIVVTLSMLLTPLLANIGERLANKMEENSNYKNPPSPTEVSDETEGHILISGYGRVGQTVARLLQEQCLPYVALDADAQKVSALRKEGFEVFYGNSCHKTVLERAGAGRAKAIIITVDAPKDAEKILDLCQTHWPRLKVYMRIHSPSQANKMREKGATFVVPETVESGMQLTARTMRDLGIPQEIITPILAKARPIEYATVEEGK